MEFKFNVTGARRKALVMAISEILNAAPKYQGSPTFAYEVGGYHIDKAGTLTGADNWELIADLWACTALFRQREPMIPHCPKPSL